MSCVALKDYENATFNGFTKRLRRKDDSEIDPRIIGFYLRSPQFRAEITAYSCLITRARLNNSIIGRLRIRIPLLLIQRKIAFILSTYDDLIENNLKRIKVLEELAQRTYEEWFVKFTIHGKKLKVDEGTGLPRGWERKKISDCCGVSGGGTPSTSVREFWEGGNIPWFSPTDLSKSSGIYQMDSASKITDLGLQKSSAKLLQPESFMMTSRATIGMFAIIDKPFSTNQGFINVTPLERIHKEYLFYNFMTRIEEFKGYAGGAIFPELSKGKFKELDIHWPIKNILQQFHDTIIPSHLLIGNLTNQYRLLKEARDILLPRLMSGEIEV